MSQKTPFLSEVLSGEHIPEHKIAYLEQRALNSFYDFVLKKFEDERLNSNLTKAKLAFRIGRGPDQVNRWLASPSNWTIGTLARLLVGIAGEEPTPQSKSLSGRPPQNTHTMSLLDDDKELEIHHIKNSIAQTQTTKAVEISPIRSALQ